MVRQLIEAFSPSEFPLLGSFVSARRDRSSDDIPAFYKIRKKACVSVSCLCHISFVRATNLDGDGITASDQNDKQMITQALELRHGSSIQFFDLGLISWLSSRGITHTLLTVICILQPFPTIIL